MFLKFDASVCRVCLEQEGSVNLFDSNSGNNIEKYLFVTFLEATENDGLPHSLCVKCNACLWVAFNFKSRAIASDNQLKSYLKTINKTFSSTMKREKPFKDLEKDLSELNSLLPEDEQIRIGDNLIDIKEEQFDIKPMRMLRKKSTIATSVSGPTKNLRSGMASGSSKKQKSPGKEILELQVLIDGNKKITVNDPNDDDEHEDVAMNEIDEEITFEITEAQNDEDNETAMEMKEIVVKNNKKPRVRSRKPAREVKDLLACSVCENTFTTELNLNRHMRMHDNSNRPAHKCNICGKLFTQLSSVRQHLLIHTGERPYPCTECPKTFRRKKTLTSHLMSHTKEKPYTCNYCRDNFSTKQALTNHTYREHETNGEKVIYKCSDCDKVYASKYSLNEHMTCAHTSEFVFKCEICSKIFYNKYAFRAHEKTHKETNTCVLCSKAFKSSKELKNHLDCHESNEEHKCEICEKVFGRIYKLMIHMGEHGDAVDSVVYSNNVKFQCKKCQKKYANLVTLHDHIREHLDQEKLFRCFDCEEVCSSKLELSVHFQSHKNQYVDNMILCSSCDVISEDFDNYCEHMIKYHEVCDNACPECGENFDPMDYGAIVQHIIDHEVVKL